MSLRIHSFTHPLIYATFRYSRHIRRRGIFCGLTASNLDLDGPAGLEHDLLTMAEAIRYLRLDIDGPAKPENTLRYYREKKGYRDRNGINNNGSVGINHKV